MALEELWQETFDPEDNFYNLDDANMKIITCRRFLRKTKEPKPEPIVLKPITPPKKIIKRLD